MAHLFALRSATSWLTLAIASAIAVGSAFPAAAATINVFAAASLADSLQEIGTAFTQATGNQVRFNFAGSSLLARQIEFGAPADVFYSADDALLDRLEQQGLLLKGTRQAPLSNRLVIIVAADDTRTIRSGADLAGQGVKRIALGDPKTVPAGIYARKYLEGIGVWSAVAPRVVPTENVRGALAAVASGNVDAGIVYQTDAAISKKVRVACTVPAAEAPAIGYGLAVLKSSSHVTEARQWVEYLGSAAAKAVFRRHGFIVSS